jgi:hypothetical protein
MEAKTRPPSSQMAENFLWADEEYLKEILSLCPTYHCRTHRLRPEQVCYINIGSLTVEVCHICFEAWNARPKRSKKIAA